MITTDLRAAASDLLSALIQINTTNPPGNETAAAEHLAAYLAEAGVESTLVGADPLRQNLVARIRGRGTGPSLLLLGHTDVVVADPSEWSVDPFSGLDRDEYIWGRGALDMKGQVAAEAVAFAALAREGWQGNGDLVSVRGRRRGGRHRRRRVVDRRSPSRARAYRLRAQRGRR